jgi:hypothetical protein
MRDYLTFDKKLPIKIFVVYFKMQYKDSKTGNRLITRAKDRETVQNNKNILFPPTIYVY